MEADLIVSCPYNPAHRILKRKLMSHVVKCKKNHKIENKVSCPLDSSHIIDRDQLQEHLVSCPGLAHLIEDVDSLQGNQNVEQTLPIEESRSAENWEEEPEVPSYNPMEVSEKKKVLRIVPGLTKSERKKFRDKERMRIAHLNGGELNTETLQSLRDAQSSYSFYSSRRTGNDSKNANTSSASDFDRSVQSSKQDTSVCTNISREFDDPFHRTLYNEFAPENDDLDEILEESLHHAELFNKSLNPETIFARDTSHIKKETQNLSNVDQNEKIKIESNAASGASGGFLNANDLKQEKSECAASTSVSSERDDLLTLLKNLNATKEKSAKEIPNQSDKDYSQIEWNEMVDRFNILTNVQNAAAEESAQLLYQLSKLKLRQEVSSKK